MKNVQVTFDAQTRAAIDFVQRTVGHGVPQRVAELRAHRRYGTDLKFLRACVRLASNEERNG